MCLTSFFRAGLYSTVLAICVFFNPKTAGASEVTLFSADWLSQMQSSLAKDMCLEGDYYLSCYKVSANECKNIVHAAFVLCQSKMKWPAKISPTGNGMQYGANIGDCIGDQFHNKVSSKRDNDRKQCKSLQTWM